MGFFSKDSEETIAWRARAKELAASINADTKLIAERRAKLAREQAPKWEYKTLEEAGEQQLKEAGSDGWELVSAYSYANPVSTASMFIRHVFKRQIPDDASPDTLSVTARLKDSSDELAAIQAKL